MICVAIVVRCVVRFSCDAVASAYDLCAAAMRLRV